MQKLIILIITIILVMAVADAALLKTVAKVKTAALAKEAPASTKDAEEKTAAPKVSVTAAKAAVQATKKNKAKPQAQDCVQEGEVVGLAMAGMPSCCPGLRPVNFRCTRQCAAVGETPRNDVPCCLLLRSIGTPPVCTAPDTSCRQRGEPYSITRAQCCEGLEFDEGAFECKPRKAGMARLPSQKAGKEGGCPDQFMRIEQKLDEILQRLGR